MDTCTCVYICPRACASATIPTSSRFPRKHIICSQVAFYTKHSIEFHAFRNSYKAQCFVWNVGVGSNLTLRGLTYGQIYIDEKIILKSVYINAVYIKLFQL